MKNRENKGAESFERHFSSVYGKRWESLKASFALKPDYIEAGNNFREPYFIDRASVLPVLALSPGPGQKILDMCAAPGGKTLLIAQAGQGQAEITANDRSGERRNRLIAVINSTLPDNLRRQITITGHDASRWGMHEKNIYDRILLDAPCSSERHVCNSAQHLAQWSPARSRQLAARQYAMLVSALDAARPGGRIVYSTCTISDTENDKVVEKLLKKKKESCTSAEIDLAEILKSHDSAVVAEKTAFGYQILPDKNRGAGPIYFSVILKN